jgi:uncharacterized protein involved in exopolysaccharide biosynthesis
LRGQYKLHKLDSIAMGAAGGVVESDKIDLKELVQALWRKRVLIASLSVGFAVVAAAAAWLQRDKFEATVMISPISKSERDGGGAAGFASQLGGVAALAGLSLGADTQKTEALAVLQSRALKTEYIAKNDLLPLLFPDRWDAKQRAWKQSKRAPTLWQASEHFFSIMQVEKDKRTDLWKVSVTWTDPVIAAKWANGLVSLANESMRQRSVREGEAHIAYLNEEGSKTDLAQVRTAIYAVLESEIKNLMLAKGPGDFALRVIDPAVPPQDRSSPNRLLWVVAGLMFGLLTSVLVVLVGLAWNVDKIAAH